MVSRLSRRLSADQSGFTLIELLVVMIIIAILMAVAVPAFLGQKQKALGTKAKTNVKNVIDAIDGCAAGLTNGTYVEGAVDCRNVATITTNEPALGPTFTAFTNGAGAPAIDAVIVELIADTQAVSAGSAIKVGATTVYFKWAKDNAGTSAKTCGQTWAGGSAAVTTPNPKACPTGRW